MTTQTHILQADDLPKQLATFGYALKAAYKDARLSKRKLASAASLDRAAISQIERGERAPNFRSLLALARAARTTPATLLAGIGPERDAIARIEHDGGPPGDGDPLRRFGANLRWLREHHEPRLSQEGLADRIDIDRSSPNGYETGRMCPNLRTILKLAAGLGVSPAVLMEGVELPAQEAARSLGRGRRRG
jgi:transcriptional regulator with XRE-family HTH domain